MHLDEVMEQVRTVAPLAREVRDLREELGALKCNSARWRAGILEGSEVELMDLVAESKMEGSYEVSADNVMKLRSLATQAQAVNRKTAVAHVIDLERWSVMDPRAWVAACGWRVCAGEAILEQIRPGFARCARKACVARWACIDVQSDGTDVE